MTTAKTLKAEDRSPLIGVVADKFSDKHHREDMTMATAIQIKLIHTIKGALCIDDDVYRGLLAGFGVESSKDLRDAQAELLLRDLEQKAIAAGVWKKKEQPKAGRRPGNIKRPEGQGRKDYERVSRAKQLQKIEALLTVGKRPWAYADALAEKICRTRDKMPIKRVAWVPTNQLYKIITALRKQALRDGWDLSGED